MHWVFIILDRIMVNIKTHVGWMKKTHVDWIKITQPTRNNELGFTKGNATILFRRPTNAKNDSYFVGIQDQQHSIEV